MRERLSAQLIKVECFFERLLLGEERGIHATLLRALLFPFSMLYCAGLSVYLWVYDSGLRKKYEADVPVVSVGNLTFGGTGKTPAVIYVCKMLQAAGYRPAVLSRGHGGSVRREVVVSNGRDILCSSKRCGDEPIVLARNLPGVQVIVGKNRRLGAALAQKLFAPDVLVLDDGMQYWQLKRDLDIVLVDAMHPFGSGYVMPAGDLREPAKGLGRASIVLLNCEADLDKDQCELAHKNILSVNPELQVHRCSKAATGFIHAKTGEICGVDWARGKKVVAFCGIGNPSSFEYTLVDTGAQIQAFVAFRDHQNFTSDDLKLIAAEMADKNAEALVTTEKDASRIPPDQLPEELYVLTIELEIEDKKSFEKHITNRVHRENKEADPQKASDKTAG